MVRIPVNHKDQTIPTAFITYSTPRPYYECRPSLSLKSCINLSVSFSRYNTPYLSRLLLAFKMSTENHQHGDGPTNEKTIENMSHDEHETAKAAARFGYGPLSHIPTTDARLPAFGGEFQPGLYKPVIDRKIANPAPLGLAAFALTTFVLSAINMGARDIMAPNLVVGIAYGYGGLVQLLAGMWYVQDPCYGRGIQGLVSCLGWLNYSVNIASFREMAAGNTFGATALSSYGGFWISFGIILTPGGFQIEETIATTDSAAAFANSFGLYLMVCFHCSNKGRGPIANDFRRAGSYSPLYLSSAPSSRQLLSSACSSSWIWLFYY